MEEGLLPRAVASVAKADFEPFANGKRIGSYLFGRTIGEGSFAKVKEGFHVSTGEKVAIKVINKKKARRDRYVSRNLKREADIMQRVCHKNVVRLLEVMETDSFYYLVTELCSGGELLDLICERKYLDEEIARKYVAQLISAVFSMHLNGVVHRDLKIENFLLSEQDDLKIVDFGLSNALPHAGLQAWKQTGVCPLLLTTHCGSPAYAAPELLAQKLYGAQVDIWSIGVNMFVMLTGNLPYNFERFNIIDMYHKMMARKMTPFPKHVSREARDLIVQLLDPVPETRLTLEEALNHPWLRPAKKYLLHCDRAAEKPMLEVNQNIVLHMADNMGMSMKEVVNSVKENRANHSFAIYFLLNEKLKRFERRKRGETSFAKVKVVKKAILKTDVSPKSKFTYKGLKISQRTLSHHTFQEDVSDSTRSDGDSDPDTPKLIDSTDHWNQYATFPRDRRTSSASPADLSKSCLASATLDKGSDDIDYRHVSSPETTDNSASSLESAQTLRRQLLNIERAEQTVPSGRARKESGSDEEVFARTRSKSLTGREEYDYVQSLLPAEGRHRASTTATSFLHLDIRSLRHPLPVKLKTLHEPNNYLLKAAKIPAHFNINSIKTWSSDINESRNGKCAHRETDIEGAARRSSVTGIFDETGDEENRFREKIDNEVEMNGKFENDSCRSRECLGNRRMLKLKDISVDGTHSDLDTENIVDNVTEIIPPPTPFSDQGVAINIEVVEPRTIMSLPCRMEKQSSAGLERKVVKAEGCWRKTASCEGHRRMTKERTHSGEAKRLEKRFRRIELEKVKRIELEPLEKNLSQVAPVVQADSPFSLQSAKSLVGHGTVTNDKANENTIMDQNNNSCLHENLMKHGKQQDLKSFGESIRSETSTIDKRHNQMTTFSEIDRSAAKRCEMDRLKAITMSKNNRLHGKPYQGKRSPQIELNDEHRLNVKPCKEEILEGVTFSENKRLETNTYEMEKLDGTIFVEDNRFEANAYEMENLEGKTLVENKQLEASAYENELFLGTAFSGNSRLEANKYEDKRHTAVESHRSKANYHDEKLSNAGGLRERKLGATPLRVNVVKLSKCQCIPVLRPKVVEPDKLVICNKEVVSRTIKKHQTVSNLAEEGCNIDFGKGAAFREKARIEREGQRKLPSLDSLALSERRI